MLPSARRPTLAKGGGREGADDGCGAEGCDGGDGGGGGGLVVHQLFTSCARCGGARTLRLVLSARLRLPAGRET